MTESEEETKTGKLWDNEGMLIGNTITLLEVYSGVSREEISTMAGVSLKELIRIENGHPVGREERLARMKTLEKLHCYFQNMYVDPSLNDLLQSLGYSIRNLRSSFHKLEVDYDETGK